MALRRNRDAAAADTVPAGREPHRRVRAVESAFVRMAMTLGIIGIGTAIAAIMGTQDVRQWIVGLVVSTLSVVLAALLWTRRRL